MDTVNEVSKITIHFPFRDDNVDCHSLTDSTILTLQNDELIDNIASVNVKGEYPWEYSCRFSISKRELDQRCNKIRRKYDEEKAKLRIEQRYQPKKLAKEYANMIVRDSRATPHGLSFENDYQGKIQFKETKSRYKVAVYWEPIRTS